MNIVYFIPSINTSGGMERILSAKANWLSSQGFEITIITTEQQNNISFFELNSNIKVIPFGIYFNENVESTLIKKIYCTYRKNHNYRILIDKYLSQHPADVLISLGGKELNFLSKYRHSHKVFAEIHYTQRYKEYFYCRKGRTIFKSIIGRLLTRKLIHDTKRLHKVIVLSPIEKTQWEKTNKNIVQIYNALPFSPSLEASKQEKRAIAVGHLIPVKGFDMLISAWKLVHSQIPDWILDIYGEGYLREELQQQIDSAGLSDIVTLHGISKKINQELLKSSLFIMSSRYEGFPMVLIEAMMAGLPIISFDCPTGPREIIEPGISGILVPPENIKALGTSIINVIKDTNLRIRLSKGAHERAKTFDFEKIMGQWESLLKTK